jgi:hypothetical protein
MRHKQYHPGPLNVAEGAGGPTSSAIPAMSTTKGSGHSKAFCKGQYHPEAFSKRHLGMCHHGFITAQGHALLAT